MRRFIFTAVSASLLIYWTGCSATVGLRPVPVANVAQPSQLPITKTAPTTKTVATSEACEELEKLPKMGSVHRLSDGRVELAISAADQWDGWELATESTHGSRLSVYPMEHVYIRNVGMLGAGAHWFQYRGDHGEFAVFSEGHWFYNIIPEDERLVQVREYGP